MEKIERRKNIRKKCNLVIDLTSKYMGIIRNISTNGLYVETIDPNAPDNYLEGKKSIPFERIEENLKIKDSKAPGGFREENITIRLTRRGPAGRVLRPWHPRSD